VEIRRPTSKECSEVQAFVQTIVDEVYGGLWAQPPLPIGLEDWSDSWIAMGRDGFIGVVLARGEWLEDLWISAGSRGRGVGSLLLSRAENEIVDRGIHTARLRVLSLNRDAIGFYRRRGWQVCGETPHERFPVLVTEMQKHLGSESLRWNWSDGACLGQSRTFCLPRTRLDSGASKGKDRRMGISVGVGCRGGPVPASYNA
jgi:GNAT superfamily N-acetyltransferase